MKSDALTGAQWTLRFLPMNGIADPPRSLKQPIRHALHDLVAFAKITAARREKPKAGDLEGLIRTHADRLAHYLPDERLPEKLVLFVGQSRSGHSLVGPLIDAHPNAGIAHEIHAFNHLRRHGELTHATRLNAHLFDLLGHAYTGYDYQVDGQWQGRAGTWSWSATRRATARQGCSAAIRTA